MKVIITGATGMVGRSTLNECLANDKVKEVLAINRRRLGIKHPKLKELIHSDFMNFSDAVEHFKGYDACFHCMGVSSAGVNEEDFSKLTYNITSQLVDTLFEVNPNSVFNYISGAGTDSSENGNVMWARVKGKTENYILNKGFKDAYMFRAGAIIPEKGIKSGTPLYNFLYMVLKPNPQ